MGFKEDIKRLLKQAEPFIAISIFIILLILAILLFNEQQLKKDISENCGWGKEDYYCYCEKNKAEEIKNKMEMPLGGVDLSGFENVSLAR